MARLTREEVREKVFALVRNQLGKDGTFELREEMRFISDLGADSLDTVEFMMKLEEEFEMSIPDTDAEQLLGVGLVVDYVHEHQP